MKLVLGIILALVIITAVAISIPLRTYSSSVCTGNSSRLSLLRGDGHVIDNIKHIEALQDKGQFVNMPSVVCGTPEYKLYAL